MAEKNRTPDILGSVLNTPAAVEPPAQSAEAPRHKTAKRQDAKTVKHQNGIPVNSEDSAPQADVEKIKATFYLAPAAVEGLEDAWLQLRRQARKAGRKGAVSKSEIVAAALQMMLEDLEAHGDASLISGKLFNE